MTLNLVTLYPQIIPTDYTITLSNSAVTKNGECLIQYMIIIREYLINIYE